MARAHTSDWLFRLLLALLFWAPLPFGSNRPWAAALLCLNVFLLTGATLLYRATRQAPGSTEAAYIHYWPLLLLLVVQVWTAVQLLPLPPDLLAALSPRAAALQLPDGSRTLSLDVAMTQYNLMLGCCYSGLFYLVTVLANSRERVEALLWTLALAAALQAVYGAGMTLTGLEYGFFVEKYVGRGVATGTFVNRNHFAAYLVLGLAAGIGLLVARLETRRPRTERQRIRAWVQTLLSMKFLLRLLLAMMVVGLVLSRSRMGNLSFFVALAIGGGLSLWFARREASRKVLVLFASLLLVDLLIVGRWFGAEEVAERLVGTTVESEQRDDVAAVTLAMIRDYPWTGSGAGTYYTVFPHYSSFVPEDSYYTHAHNDYLELAATLGLPATAVLGLFLLATLVRGLALMRQGGGRLEAGVACCVVMSGTWLLLHSGTDFNLQIPANAATAVSLLALAWREGQGRGLKGNKSRESLAISG
jgi:O-antigen ligase